MNTKDCLLLLHQTITITIAIAIAMATAITMAITMTITMTMRSLSIFYSITKFAKIDGHGEQIFTPIKHSKKTL